MEKAPLKRPLRIAVTGLHRGENPQPGASIIRSIRRGKTDIARAGKLVALSDDQPDGSTRQSACESRLARVTLEQRGPVRSVVKLEGMHRDLKSSRAWLPFRASLAACTVGRRGGCTTR